MSVPAASQSQADLIKQGSSMSFIWSERLPSVDLDFLRWQIVQSLDSSIEESEKNGSSENSSLAEFGIQRIVQFEDPVRGL